MAKFIAAIDHSGGSTGSVLSRYSQTYTEENKMDFIHAMRLRMMGSPSFTNDNIWAAILYKDSVDRGLAKALNTKGIAVFLKIDSGCEPDGTLKPFDVDNMISFAQKNNCVGTKMRSIVTDMSMLIPVVQQQIAIAEKIVSAGIIPIIEPEVPITHPEKSMIEEMLEAYLMQCLHTIKAGHNSYTGVILKLTLPDTPNLYHDVTQHEKVHRVVALSGGYSTAEACMRLGLQDDVTASFSRALSEGLFYDQTDEEFNNTLSDTITRIVEASGE